MGHLFDPLTVLTAMSPYAVHICSCVRSAVYAFVRFVSRIQSRVFESPASATVVLGSAFFLLQALYTAMSRFGAHEYPLLGFRSWLEPDLLVRLRFSWGASLMVKDGYKLFGDSIYRLGRNDRDVTVIGNKYVDELRNLPKNKLNNTAALLNNMGSKYNGFEILRHSNLHTRMLQTKLTPSLPLLVGALKDELDFAIEKVVAPKIPSDGWTPVTVFDLLVQLVTRMSSRAFVGHLLCRNEHWIETTIKYSENGIFIATILNFLPSCIRPFVVPLLPQYWATHHWIRRGIAILDPIIEQRRNDQIDIPLHQRPQDLLQWMMDHGDEQDGQPENLARRELVMSLASIHSSGMAALHVLLDLCAHPGYVALLREEVIATLRETGGVWTRDTPGKLRKMDSFFKESQRVNPVALLNFYRVVQDEPIMLHDGRVLRPGTQICTDAYSISHDPSIVPDQGFDGLRYFKLRQNPENEKKYRYTDTDKTHLHFGHGRHACPGRFLISLEMKMIVAELLLRYDMKYPEGKSRPRNINVDEFLFPDPRTKLEMRSRVDKEFSTNR